jgi:YYY domain-containing protein
VWRWETAALLVIVLLGAGLRFHGLGWDQPPEADRPLQMHPDERFLSLVANRIDWPDSAGGYFDTANSPLNPYNDGETNSYVYGTFPLFLVKAVATFAGDDPAGPDNSYDYTVVWGRRVTALFDTATILLVFAVGWRLFGSRAGLLGALLYAMAVLPTQLAHFWTADPYLTFFATLTLLLSVLWVRSSGAGSWWLAVGFGVSIGLAVACKVNGAIFAVLPVTAFGIRVGLRDFPRLGLAWRGGGTAGGRDAPPWTWANDFSMLSLAGAVSLVVFRLAQPYAFDGPNFWDMALNQRWWDDLQRERDFQQGNADYPPFVQFAGTTPFLTPLKNMVVWGLGPALGIAAWAAMAGAAVLMFRRREMAFALPLVAGALVFGFWGPRFVAFMRYFQPMYAVLAVFAGWGLVALWGWARRGELPTKVPLRRALGRVAPGSRGARVVAGAVLAVVLGATAWWALAFQSVYSQEHPRIAATRWVYENLPDGTAITSEIWDDPVPWHFPERPREYRMIETEPYEPDSPQKIHKLVYGDPANPNRAGLDSADYVAITSNRIRESVKKLEREYPATIRYYELLESGELGFERVATFQVHPTFLGISIDDSGAEESFTVYDHPEVRIYRKTDAWDAERALALLNGAHSERAVNLLPRQGRTNGLQFTPEEAETQQSGGTFTEVFDADGWASSLPWLWWLIWLEIAALATVPWVTWLFKALPGRGYGLSKFLGLTTVALPTWLLVAWGAAHFSGGLVWSVFGASIAVGVVVGVLRRGQVARDARANWRAWLAVDGVFLAAFFIFLLIRAYNPDLWHHPQGGEKPMEIAYLTAVTRSTIMPPYDPWFGGGSMNYYYMGWFFLAVPIRALRIVPEVAFNLGVPTYAALAASVAFTVVHWLVGLASQARSGASRVAARPAVLAGAFGAVLLAGIGNLDGAHQWIERVQSVNEWSLAEGVPVVGGAVGIAGGLWQWLFGGAALPPFDWWRSSRVHFGSFDITEFPYWSMLFADLHPHVMGLPFFGATIALVVAYAASVRAGLRAQGWIIAGILGGAVGLVRTVHTWDFVTAVLIAAAGVPLGQMLREGRWQSRWWDAVGHLALAGAVAAIAFSPYTAHFETFDPGVVRAPETTKAHQFFVHFGVFIAFGVAFLAVRYREELVERRFVHGRNPFFAVVNGRMELLSLAIFLSGVAAFTWVFGLTTIALGLVGVAFFLNLLWFELARPERDVARTLATALYVLGFAVAVGVDVVTLKNDIERMNTVFKFSLQAWQLLALASAFAAWYAGREAKRVLAAARARDLPRRDWRVVSAISGTAVVVGLVFGASLFLISGTRARQNARFEQTGPTLDGFAFLPSAVFVEPKSEQDPTDDVALRLEDDRALIAWLRENVEGSPVIVEAVGPLYRWTGRISQYTGLPAVVGWDWHQIQQRTDYAGLVQRRRSETELFYTSGSTQLAVDYLGKYDVRYVVVGGEERVHGTPEGLAKFEEMPALREVFRNGDDRIYAVDQSQLVASYQGAVGTGLPAVP